MTDLETSLLDAFRFAEASRKAAGFAPRKLAESVTQRRDGTKWTGPSRYKVTLWLHPWVYADAMHAKSTSARPDQSLTRFLEAKLEDIIPKVAARPTPKPDNVVPLRRKKSPDFSKAARNPYAGKLRARG